MSMPKALQGIKVVDFGTVALEPVNVKHLADQGATVIRIESHSSPDVLRITRPWYKFHMDGSMFFNNNNTSKLSITLDLSKRRGMDICWRLIKWADVVACGRNMQWMEAWGLDYESVRKIRPDIIYYNTTLVGSYGPDSSIIGFGYIAGAVMGVQQLTGWPDRGPSNTAGVLADTSNFLLGTIAILSALEYRDRTGEGQFIDLAQLETYLWSQSPWLLDYTVNGRIAARSGNRYPLYADNAPYGVFRCKNRDGKERWAAICVTNDQEWRSFCKVIGQPAWTNETRFASAWSRRQNEDELEKLVNEWTKEHSAEEVESMMQKAGVPASVVESNKDVYEDPQLTERGYFRKLQHTELGAIPFSGPPFKLSKTPDAQFASPCMGEHNEYVMRDILGMSEDEINMAIVDGGITTEYDMADMSKK